MSAHTPGPWNWNADGYLLLSAADVDERNAIIELDEPQYMETGDKSLIAAAPELLVACKAALNARMYREWPEVADLLIAAIAKAEGR
jgi:hypothetical protein